MTTTRLGSGLAFTPGKDLEMFARMAAQGKQLSGLGALGHGWTFTDAPPEHVVFDLAHESHPSADYFDIFAAAGWSHVLSAGDLHIFKAAPGTRPVHTAAESRREELVRQRDNYLRYGGVALAALVMVALLLRAVAWNAVVETALLVAVLIPVVYTLLPLAGFTARLRKLQ